MTNFKNLCQVCRRVPVVMPQVDYCFTCWPGGPVTPPPCLRCGSRINYYASGLCTRCHISGKPNVESCPDCHAWGTTRTTEWLCRACLSWRRNHTVAACRTCNSVVAVADNGFCRLCHKQASMARPAGGVIDFIGANRDGQQLFLADMLAASYQTAAASSPLPSSIPALPSGSFTPATVVQLTLFQTRRDLASCGRAVLAQRCDPALAGQVDRFVGDHAHRHGWDPKAALRTALGIRILYGLQDEPGTPIKASDADLLRAIELPVIRVVEILAEMGQLEDDRGRTVDGWFMAKTLGLPEQIREELSVWFLVMRDGSTAAPRRKKRSELSINIQLRHSLLAIELWVAAGTTSLRQVSRDDILQSLPTGRNERALCGQGLKSIFAILKQRKIVFRDPAARIATGYPQPQEPLPHDPALLRAALNSHDSAQAVIVALVAYYGLRLKAVRGLQLTDIQGSRITLDGRNAPLAPAVKARVAAYLNERTATWPSTANPHLLINSRSAWRTTPVGQRWIKLKIGHQLTVQSIREDRILYEAHASRGDTRRLSDLFGLSIKAAGRYTDTVDSPGFSDLPLEHNISS